MPMKTTLKNLFALFMIAGLVSTSHASSATPTKKPKAQAERKSGEIQPNVVKKASKKQGSVAVAPPVEQNGSTGLPKLASSSVAVFDQTTGDTLYEKNANAVVPIASITKLMTAMVVLDAHLGLDEVLSIGDADVDLLKGTHSRLSVGAQLTREEMLRLALMSSENRAASALGRHYPGGREAFIAAMNGKAIEIGLTDTRFSDSTGLTPANVSSARDLVRLVSAAHQYPLIREFSTADSYQVLVKGRPQHFHNTNALVKSDNWTIGLSKTGYISEAGKCLVMQAWLNDKPTIIVLLDSWGKLTRIGDAQRIKRWVESLAAGKGSPIRG